jgi:hypothetical protein
LFEKAGVVMPTEETNPTIEEALASLAPLPVDDPLDELETLDAVEVGEVDRETDSPYSGLEPAAIVDISGQETGLDADSELEAEVKEHLEEAADPWLDRGAGRAPAREAEPEREPDPAFEPFTMRPEPIGASVVRNTPEPSFISPPEPFLITPPTPPVVEPSYMEDTEQRQMYRVRNLATVVLFIGLVIVLLWSMSNTLDALGTWWDDFTGTLRL